MEKLGHMYKHLGYTNKLYISERLCPTHQKILQECLDYKRNKEIASCWSYIGIINIKFSENKTERPIRIYSLEEFRFTVEYHHR